LKQPSRDGADLAALASLYFSRPIVPVDEAAPAHGEAVRDEPAAAGIEAPPVRAPRLLVLGCPGGRRSFRVAVSLVTDLVRSGCRAGLVEVGGSGPAGLPVPRLRVPAGAWPGAPPRLGPRALRLLGRGLRSMEGIVVHGTGADGPLQRVLALGSTRAVIVPGMARGEREGAMVQETLRACLEGSHRLRVAVVGQVPLPFRGHPRIVALGGPETRRPAGLPTEWRDWLRRAHDEPAPMLDTPWRAVRLLAP